MMFSSLILFGFGLGLETPIAEKVKHNALAIVCPVAKMKLESFLNPSAIDSDLQHRSEVIQAQIKGLSSGERAAIDALTIHKMITCIQVPDIDKTDDSPAGLGRQMAALMCLKMRDELRLKIGEKPTSQDMAHTDEQITAILTKTLSIRKPEQKRFKESSQKTMIQCIRSPSQSTD